MQSNEEAVSALAAAANGTPQNYWLSVELVTLQPRRPWLEAYAPSPSLHQGKAQNNIAARLDNSDDPDQA